MVGWVGMEPVVNRKWEAVQGGCGGGAGSGESGRWEEDGISKK